MDTGIVCVCIYAYVCVYTYTHVHVYVCTHIDICNMSILCVCTYNVHMPHVYTCTGVEGGAVIQLRREIQGRLPRGIAHDLRHLLFASTCRLPTENQGIPAWPREDHRNYCVSSWARSQKALQPQPLSLGSLAQRKPSPHAAKTHRNPEERPT